jgi:D-sedoheptulose 7-phosphate isomerase
MRINEYFGTLKGLMDRVEGTDREGRGVDIEAAFASAVGALAACGKRGGKGILIGNGGSAAIASHTATDLWKLCGIRGTAFNDASLLTCIGNDCGIEDLFARPVRMFADEGDVLVAISSSGASPNILGGVRAARERGCLVVTLSGMGSGNPLRGMGEVNFYVPSDRYGFVETLHGAICHALIDALKGER